MDSEFSSSNGTRCGKHPYFPASGTDHRCRSPLCGALGQGWSASLESFTIITTAASPELSDIHHRQPAIVDPTCFADWLDPASRATLLLDL